MDLVARRVQRLPDDLVNKIAAGEVVERPASVVKELVENALDAGARSVQVDVEGGGRTLIRVRDDGHGMGREDAQAALERHATSKLRALADLDEIATHGFRGEALPSIASVSHLWLRTRDDSGPAGTEVEIKHGRPVHVRDAGHPRGATVEVRDLFGEVPARRKFLRADSTEAGHVAEAVTLLALAWPQVGFTLTSGGRQVIQAPPTDGLASRLFQLFGGAFVDDLAEVEEEGEGIRVYGFVARPDRPRSARPNLRLFVNGRPVRDRAVAKAVAEAYRAAGAGDYRGDACLFLELPLHLVDVNVHPAKAEVRFAQPRAVWTIVERAVRHGLSHATRRAPRAEVASRPLDYGVERSAEPHGAGLVRDREAWAHGPAVRQDLPTPSAGPATLLDDAGPSVLGQHRNTYVVATDGEDLLLFDQHTSHERIRFEAIQEQLKQRRVESQLLLAPVVLQVAPRLRPLLERHRETLRDLGFDLEEFGGDTLHLRALPAVLPGRDPAAAVSSILQDLLDREESEWAVAEPRDRVAATLACHSSVRGGQALSLATMAALVRDLPRTAHPTLCPHGRPTVVRLDQEEVTRWFGRTGWRRR
ncbi:MAG TPA: DNA mismatch repair endonuclease MutL [Vicinamibacteria bacterium]|nr:DNA mismatch repair endonuclease MutL [Vicinamibacteria bacterium]